MYQTSPANAMTISDRDFDADHDPLPYGPVEIDLDPDFDLDYLDPAFTDADDERLTLYWVTGPVGAEGSPLMWHLSPWDAADAGTECGGRVSQPAMVAASSDLGAHDLRCGRCRHLAARYLDNVSASYLNAAPDTMHWVGDEIL